MPKRLENLNWQEFGELVPQKYKTVILPVGTIEAHGIISLGTDVQISIGIAELVADDLKAILAPPIWYGVTRTLYSYPGSLTVSSETFEKYVTELFFSLLDKGFSRIVVINGHGGHIKEFDNAALKLNREREGRIIIVHWWIFCEDVAKEVYGFPGGHHAGVNETAAILALDKKLVLKKRYKDDMTYFSEKGISAYPGPATIFLEEKGKSYPDFDEKKAKVFLNKSVEKILKKVLDIFKRWEKMES
jgi:creatinine amidohydrolase